MLIMEEKNYDDQINQLLKTSHTGEWASQDIARAQVYAILSLRDAVRTLESRISLFKIDDSETVRSYGDHEALWRKISNKHAIRHRQVKDWWIDPENVGVLFECPKEDHFPHQLYDHWGTYYGTCTGIWKA